MTNANPEQRDSVFRISSAGKRAGGRRTILFVFLLFLNIVPLFSQTLTGVNGGKVYLNIGGKAGVRVGMTAFILKGEEVSGQTIMLKIAKIRISAVKAHSCTAEIVEQNKQYRLSRGLEVQFIDTLKPVKAPKPRLQPEKKPRPPVKPRPFQIEPGKDLVYYMDKGNRLLKAGDISRARLYFRRVLRDVPDDPLAKEGISRCDAEQHRLEQQKREAEKRQQLLKNADYYEKMGDRAAESGQPDIALSYYDKILSVIPDDARLLEKKADTLLAVGRKKEGKSVLKTLLSHHPDRSDIRAKLKAIVSDPGDIETVELPGHVKLELCYIPAGTFMMGSPDSEKGRYDIEGPRHRVTISKAFFMGKYEVTQAQWQIVMGNNPSDFKGANLPVENVSWNDCQEFIRKLNRLTGKHFRLPTEAEWEYACRVGTDTAFCYGNGQNQLFRYAWYRENCGGHTHSVGQKQPNAWGLYDMHGNVWEWCSDWYDENYYKKSPTTDPRGPSSAYERVSRGGGWVSGARRCRSAGRNGSNPFNRRSLGFRLVMEVE